MSVPIEYVCMENYCCCSSSKNKMAKLKDLAILQRTIPGEGNSVIYVTQGRCPFCGHVFTVSEISLPAPILTL